MSESRRSWREPTCLAGRILFTRQDALDLLAAHGRIPPLAEDRLDDFADGLQAAAISLFTRMLMRHAEPSRADLAEGLSNLVRLASSLLQRLQDRRATERQVLALNTACERLPPSAVLGLADAAAGSDPLEVGRARLEKCRQAFQELRPGASADQLAAAEQGAAQLSEWASAAAQARPFQRNSQEAALAISRRFAVLVMELVHANTGAAPSFTRQGVFGAVPGSVDGPMPRLLTAAFAHLRRIASEHPETSMLATDPALAPGAETLAEWIRTAQGKARRLRGA
jgi:hypothetical protein